MISARNLDMLDRMVWILIYGGLIAAVLGYVVAGASVIAAWSLAIPGAIAAIAGIVLIAIRPRLNTPDGGAESGDASERGTP
jgi:hypothetical protein